MTPKGFGKYLLIKAGGFSDLPEIIGPFGSYGRMEEFWQDHKLRGNGLRVKVGDLEEFSSYELIASTKTVPEEWVHPNERGPK